MLLKTRQSMYFFMVLILFLLAVFSAYGQETIADNFSTVSYANNDGTSNFSGNWVESGETTDPAVDRIQINSNQLMFQNLDGISIARSLNLAGASSATLTLDYNRTSGNESISVQLWNGTSYTTIATLAGTGSVNYDLVANQMSASSSIRFISGSGLWGNSETIFVDNVQFSATFVPFMSIEDISVNEDDGIATFTVTHSGINTTGSFTLDYTTVDGSAIAPADYTADSGTLVFSGTVGDTEQIEVVLIDDSIVEPDEIFTIQFTTVSNGSVVITDTGTGTIVNDDNDPDTIRPYMERYSMNLKGDFLMRGNTNLRCTANCPSTPVTNNPPVVMNYIDVDSDGTTVNSSRSNFTVPVGSTVVWAGLYWGGMYNSSNSGITNPSGTLDIDQVKFMEPGASSYTTVNAEVRNIETTRFPGWRTFMSFAEVTAQVQAGGDGDYYVADIALATGSSFTGPHGGWTMVVVYNDPSDNTRNVSVWDGFKFFGYGGADDSFTVTGLLTPATGVFETHAAYYGMDGEVQNTGDFVRVNGTTLSNALNPNNNTLNGTISEYGVDVGGRNPNFGYSWGVDIDMFDATGLVPNGATSLAVVLGSTDEGVWGGVFAVSNEIAFPVVSSKTFTPGTLLMGDEATVTLVFDNPIQGVPLTNASLTDNLPPGMVIAPTPNASSSCGATLSAIPGNSFFNASSFTLPAGGSCTFTFDVITNDIGEFTNIIYTTDVTNNENIPLAEDSSADILVKVKTVITNRKITYRVNKN